MIRSKNIERLESSAVKLSLTVKKAAGTKEYNELMAKYSKDAQIKGFRKGKVPTAVLERKFGEGLRREAAGNLIDKAFREALEDIDLKPLGFEYPEVLGEPILTPGEDFSFEVIYDTFPEIKLGDYKGLPTQEMQVELLPKHEEEELEKLREQNAMVMDKPDGVVAEKDIVTLDYSEIEEEREVPGSQREDYVFTVGTGYNLYKIDDALVGMKKGEEKKITKEYPADFEDKELAGRTVLLKVKVKEVKEKQLPSLDDELAQDISENFQTLDDLKKHIKTQMEERVKTIVRDKKVEALMEKLIESCEIDLPKTMVKTELDREWQNFIRQSQMPEEQVLKLLELQGQTREKLIETWQEGIEKKVQGQLILNKIAEEEKIEVSEEDMEAEIGKQAAAYNMPEETLKKTFGERGMKEYLVNDILQKKTIDFLLENAKVTKSRKKVDYNELPH